MEVVALGSDAVGRVTAALRDNRVVCLVSDRDLSGDGVEVEFFGERTTLPAGPATLALRTGAPILPVAVYFGSGRRHHGVVRPPIDTTRGSGRLRDDVARITQDLAHEFESLIAAEPQQWHLMQPNWPSDHEA
jgi:KDO2-lipid IV(A) lauroyltransferase